MYQGERVRRVFSSRMLSMRSPSYGVERAVATLSGQLSYMLGGGIQRMERLAN